MITIKELNELIKDRLKDAEILMKAKRYDGAYYLCGYAIELALKRRICKALNWDGFPNNKKEFENLNSFKVHNLDSLLCLSGKEKKIKKAFLAEWSIINEWNPETRYACRTKNKQDVIGMLDAAKKILREL
ncbi:hypothetical protein [Candidatus Protochlamydia phocaeensis]|uniref:hypothetical protein n=1 Tax=Candidatus Protochlamydia phocaeensis TaxID=1414722 RepID=UPI000838D86A|nr:hypothetical protein [Candidatus Protochlamydia phocaeensis]